MVNNAAMNRSVQISVWVLAFDFLGYIPRSGIAGSYANSMFNFWRNCLTVFHSTCTILLSHQQRRRAPIFLHPRQYLFFSVFLIVTILIGVRCYLIVVWICISLMTGDTWHLFMCLLAICKSPLEKCPLPVLKLGCLFLLLSLNSFVSRETAAPTLSAPADSNNINSNNSHHPRTILSVYMDCFFPL